MSQVSEEDYAAFCHEYREEVQDVHKLVRTIANVCEGVGFSVALAAITYMCRSILKEYVDKNSLSEKGLKTFNNAIASLDSLSVD